MFSQQSTEKKFGLGWSLNAVLIVFAIVLSPILAHPILKTSQPHPHQTLEFQTVQAFVPVKSGLPARRVGGGCR
jgi:hypothetical protein